MVDTQNRVIIVDLDLTTWVHQTDTYG